MITIPGQGSEKVMVTGSGLCIHLYPGAFEPHEDSPEAKPDNVICHICKKEWIFDRKLRKFVEIKKW